MSFEATLLNSEFMMAYERISASVNPAPSRELIDLFNHLEIEISSHPKCINDLDPFTKLNNDGSFCLSATSIQSHYIAFVLGKYHESSFPPEVLQLIFNIPPKYKLQFKEIQGHRINGCICAIQLGTEKLDLVEVYNHIYKV